MNLFSCQNCGQVVYFENVRCERCQRLLGFQSDTNAMAALTPLDNGVLRSERGDDVRYCANAAHGACNWLVSASSDPSELCEACRLNRTIPDLGVSANLQRWQRLEIAKRRLVYSLRRLRLPLTSGHDRSGGLLFDFLSGHAADGHEKPVVTGHADGVITVDLEEADPAVRVQRRQQLGERFRTLLGHFRHEAGHYYWPSLVERRALWDFRSLFGDESADYSAALARHYGEGPPADWNQRFVTPYASSHPHEDWAETFAHYIHIVDTLDSARAFGVRSRPHVATASAETAECFVLEAPVESYREKDFDRLWRAWLPLTIAVNELNRSMGNDDLYPFVLPTPAIEKLRFVHRLIRT